MFFKRGHRNLVSQSYPRLKKQETLIWLLAKASSPVEPGCSFECLQAVKGLEEEKQNVSSADLHRDG